MGEGRGGDESGSGGLAVGGGSEDGVSFSELVAGFIDSLW